MKAVLPALARPLLEPHLPADLAVHWFTSREDAEAAIGDADIGWVDLQSAVDSAAIAARGERLRWLFTLRAGIDDYDLAQLAARGTVLTNGTGINAVAVAEYAVLGILAAAKRYDEVVRLADRQAWPTAAPGTTELAGSSALIVGYGTIGRLIGARLAAFDVAVTGVTRSGRDGSLRPDAWKSRLGAFDWVILAAPSTAETEALVGAAEFMAMKPSAWLVNIARGGMVDQPALIEALAKRRIAGAFLDTVDPEPLPPGDPLWTAPNTLHSMHLSGRSQSRMFQRAAALFLENFAAFQRGEAMRNVVDPQRGY
ncbi:D-2-hydroxyacid dehydrogenase [Sphingomonas baiyangensis]|uniref:D-2-hydroxyacid dehydrogenase n=1 Tax=Sphingomonas baiyangensis TaxID=2572576 RepID=A0A4U1L3W1_9SPHN|nr:D-2-hydroxyacid dehydrogenase [Sphingomonas baiyangensis]TKD50816.1 D-2-hydroxyacid dehydrogenase [Sphingomonas baiyangensis]